METPLHTGKNNVISVKQLIVLLLEKPNQMISSLCGGFSKASQRYRQAHSHFCSSWPFVWWRWDPAGCHLCKLRCLWSTTSFFQSVKYFKASSRVKSMSKRHEVHEHYTVSYTWKRLLLSSSFSIELLILLEGTVMMDAPVHRYILCLRWDLLYAGYMFYDHVLQNVTHQFVIPFQKLSRNVVMIKHLLI